MNVTYYYRSDPTRQLLQVGANVKNLKVGDWVVPIKTPFGKLTCPVIACPAVRLFETSSPSIDTCRTSSPLLTTLCTQAHGDSTARPRKAPW
jgi:hypothetical protein